MSDLPMPSINWSTGVLTQDLLREHFAQLSQFLRQSVSLLGNAGYGVVDASDPGVLQSTGDQKPLWVSEVSKTAYNIYNGMAVTPSGDFVFLAGAGFTTVNLVDLSGNLNLFVLKYGLQDTTTRSLSVTGQLVPNGQVPVTSLMCITEAAYLGFDYETRSRLVVLGAVAFSPVNANQLFMQPTSDRPWLRKWFSLVDVEHRSHIGTGTVTPTNPHGIGIGDLKVGDLSIYDQLTSSGMVLSKDTSISGVPGYFCSDAFSASQVKTDLTGYTTAESFFGGVSIYYVELTSVPNVICGAYDTGLNTPISVDHITGTKIVVLYLKTIPANFAIHYTKSPSLSVSSVTATSIAFNGVANNEIVLSGGVSVGRLAQGSFPVRKFSSIPRNFRVYIDSDGFLVGDPTVVVQPTRINDNEGINLVPLTLTPKKPSFIGIGAHGVGANIFSFTVTVVGILADGITTSTEDILFDNSTYVDVPLPPALHENDQQVLYTQKSYSSISNVTIDVTTPGILDAAVVVVYSKLDASKHRYAQIASGFWNGREALNLHDSRRVLPTVRDGVYGTTAITATAEVLIGANEILAGTAALNNQRYKRVTLVCAEDFREPRFLDATSVLWEGREILDCPVIPKDVRDSSYYRSCYRSRIVPLRKYESELCGFVVILNSVDTSNVEAGSVRVILKNDPTYEGDGVTLRSTGIAECVLTPMLGDLSGRIYIGYTNVNYRSAGFVISGKCAGFAAYFINADAVSASYVVPVYPR